MTQAKISITAVDLTGAAFSSAKARLAGLQGEAQALAGRFVGLGGAIAGALAATGLGAFVQGSIDSLDALNDLSDATGASIENLSALRAVAESTGAEFDTVRGALLKFNQTLAGARAGSEAEQIFKALGLSVAELRKQDPAEALLATAKAFQSVAVDGEAARAAQQLFGRSIGEVAPFLRDLADAGQLVARNTSEQAAQADVYSKNLAALRANASQAGRDLAADLLPALNNIAGAFTNSTTSGSAFSAVAAGVSIALQSVVVLGANVAFVFAGIGREIGAWLAQANALSRLNFSGFRAISEAVTEDAKRARAELEDFERRVLGVQSRANNPAAASGGGAPAAGTRSLLIPQAGPTANAAKLTDFERYLEQLRAAQIATLDLSREEQTRVDIASGSIKGLTEQQRQLLLTEARGVDQLAKLKAEAAEEERNGIEAAQALRRQQAQEASEIERLITSSQGARQEQLATLARRVSEEYNAGRLSAEDFGRAVETLAQEFAALAPAVEKTADAVSDFAQQAASNIQDTLGESLQRVLAGNFRGIGQLWQDTVQRMIAQAAAARLNTWLFGDSFGKTGQVGGAIGTFVSWLGGLGGRATGGPVQAGRPYMVGEQGRREIFVPDRAGRVMSAADTQAAMSGSGGTTYRITINGGAVPGVEQQIARALQRFERDRQRNLALGMGS